jgi:hypothetical protein
MAMAGQNTMNLTGTLDWTGARRIRMAAGLIWVCFIGAAPGKAQVAPQAQETEATFRLLTAAEGRAIVKAAWEQDQPARGTQDCSHLVHQIYLNAGFEYPYASSYDIYSGNENFARVKTPQAGDLVVWPGHVGIIVDPMEHSFYSLVSSGLDAQDYQGAYWKSRGRPRFYRYKLEGVGSLRPAKMPAPVQIPNATRQHSGASIVEKQPASEGVASNRPPTAASERKAVIYGPPAPVEPETAAAAATEVPSSILFATANKLPTRGEVTEAISELNNAAGNVLRAGDPSKLQMPVVIYEQLSVERVEIKKDHGWARLQIDSKASITGGGTDLKRRREKVRWELRRTESGWEAVTPSDRAYVPKDVAVQNLADQLARLTASDGAAAHEDRVLRRESRLANLLSVLLENK